jgi:5-(carboxyamino)imidazole ribonucleotide synthase
MLAEAGAPLGMTFRFWDPGAAEPIQGLGEHIRAPWTDEQALERFVDGLDVATYEFENVPVALAERVHRRVELRPGAGALEVAQDRVTEKSRFEALGIPTDRWRAVDDADGLRDAVTELGLPAVLKTRRLGYDGKGQEILRAEGEVESAFDRLGGVPCILESFVPFDREVSLVAVRTAEGAFHPYPLVENRHESGILVRTDAPARRVSDAVRARAEGSVRALADALDYVGTLAVEFFQVGEELLANEMAPRVHNSGHWTQDGAVTSQFENHMRAVCDMPIGDTAAARPTVMINLIGRRMLPAASDPEGVTIHDYGKSERPGRKVGHVNVTASSPAEAGHRAETFLSGYDGPELAPGS